MGYISLGNQTKRSTLCDSAACDPCGSRPSSVAFKMLFSLPSSAPGIRKSLNLRLPQEYSQEVSLQQLLLSPHLLFALVRAK